MMFTETELQADIDFLLSRSMQAGQLLMTDERDTGLSSNSLVRLAYRPGSIVEMPLDEDDLGACERAYAALPAHRKTIEVLEALDSQRQAIITKRGAG